MKLRYAAVLGVVAALFVATPAFATVPSVNVVHVIGSPDDGDPAWARDSFDRTTTITPQGDKFLVEIADEGTFKMAAGPSGEFSGGAQWLVTGDLLDVPATSPAIDRSTVATKGTFTSEWWKHFFADGATSPGITDWEWSYSRCSGDAEVVRTENADGVSDVTYEDLAQAVCPTPTATATPSATASPSATKAPAASSTTAAPPVAAKTLPVTGSSPLALIPVGGAAVLLGVAAVIVVTRRRRNRFEA